MRSVHNENGPAIEQAEIKNNTTLSLEEIETFFVVGVCRNMWRQRWVTLYDYDETRVVSVGCAFDNSAVIIALELKEAFQGTLNAFPSTYVYR